MRRQPLSRFSGLTRSVRIPMHPIPVEISVGAGKILSAILRSNEHTRGIVIFAHGSGSSRFSVRNTEVAEQLSQRNIGSLLFDLLDEEESKQRERVFDIPLLAQRLSKVSDWIEKTTHLPQAFFGGSTGAGAALEAVTLKSIGTQKVNCIVSRGGTGINRLGVLKKVDVPVLFIVGSRDDSTWAMNRLAYSNISTENKDKDLRVIDGASHLFEEPGKMQEVIDLSVSWFDTYL